MRILFTIHPNKTLFEYLVPLAWALRTAGHEVRVASQPAFADVITQAGLTAQPIGKDHDPWDVPDPDQPSAGRAGLPRPYDVAADPGAADWEHLRDGYADAIDTWHKLETFSSVPDLVTFARFWRPDLIVWEATTYAGAIAAKACGAAHARFIFGLDLFGVTREHFLRLKGDRPEDPLAEWLGKYATKYGLKYSEDLATGQFTIDQFPASLRLSADLQYVPARFTPYEGPALVAKWLWGSPERARVALVRPIEGYPVAPRELAESLAELDAEIVVSTAQEWGPVPDNVRVVADAPLHALIPTCSAVVHHADFGSTALAAAYGVPQVTLPWHFDQPIYAGRLAAQGAGLSIAPEDAGAAAVAGAVRRALTDPSLRDGAARLRAEMQALPTANQVVGRLEELTVKHRVPSVG
ncbi:nucleotide disphospho-sugar-binding domain-containing protein [Nonomuraea angiospora]|uniref:nucleotide disphospho-sugar-binding domain-containing protein n=1 Tax=Nonomuraea angiospora TaxID=46172 RepID=UPI0034298046